jgi:hypothetical protein
MCFVSGGLIKYVICECRNTLKVLCVWGKAWRMCVQYVGTLRKCVLCLWKQFDSVYCLHGGASDKGVLCVGTLLECA